MTQEATNGRPAGGEVRRPGHWLPDEEAVRRLSDRVIEQLGDHLSDADAHAPAYAREYAASVVRNRRSRPRPANLHPKLAELVRDLTLDEAASARRGV